MKNARLAAVATGVQVGAAIVATRGVVQDVLLAIAGVGLTLLSRLRDPPIWHW